MDDLWTIKRFCRWKYDLPDGVEPSVSQTNSVARSCRLGDLPAFKLCGEWRIDTAQILKEVRDA